ncbi:hypothetical protein ABZ642_09780 [Streptomyces sp. NPDC007157]|uniref:hypothetical protein n=1 Tax=Streptomyces sp. NPDC007157 TaxID=3154681 RepID=UPI0033D1025D
MVYPTGVALGPQRRTAAVDWARSVGGLVLEDDYAAPSDSAWAGALDALCAVMP